MTMVKLSERSVHEQLPLVLDQAAVVAVAVAMGQLLRRERKPITARGLANCMRLNNISMSVSMQVYYADLVVVLLSGVWICLSTKYPSVRNVL